jgi:hypothetical protein
MVADRRETVRSISLLPLLRIDKKYVEIPVIRPALISSLKSL